jgi:hypothetical protein
MSIKELGSPGLNDTNFTGRSFVQSKRSRLTTGPGGSRPHLEADMTRISRICVLSCTLAALPFTANPASAGQVNVNTNVPAVNVKVPKVPGGGTNTISIRKAGQDPQTSITQKGRENLDKSGGGQQGDSASPQIFKNEPPEPCKYSCE